MEGGTAAGLVPGDDPAGTAPAFTVDLPADPARLAPTRERLRGWLRDHGVSDWDVETVLIATGEACANAIEHGYRFAPEGITTLRAELHDDHLVIEVRDRGGWRPDADGDPTDRGRGRMIMTRVMDEVSIVGTPEGTTVHLVKRLTGGGAARSGGRPRATLPSEDQL